MSVAPPASAHRFVLELDGVEVAWFVGCSGPRSRTEVVEILEGGVNDRAHKRHGRTTWDPVVLRTATATSGALWDWRETCLQGDHEARRSGAILLQDDAGRTVRRYDLTGMWPIRWSGPDLDGAGADVALEELEVAVDDVRVS